MPWILVFVLWIAYCEANIEEKVGQLLMVHFKGTTANSDAERLISEAHVGGFIYFNCSNGLTSPEQVRNLSHGLQTLSKTPLLIAIDQEGGRVSRLKPEAGFSVFPSNAQIAETKDPTQAFTYALSLAEELRSVGINMNLAPVVDVNINPFNPTIGDRAYSDDPETVVLFGKQALIGYKQAGVIATLKHFPGYGDVSVDPHFALPRVERSLEQLESVELYPFDHLLDDADAIMTAHLLVSALDPINPATLSRIILEDLLREKMGFQGVILSDSLTMEGVLKQTSIEEVAIQAILAGCDILVIGIASQRGCELAVDEILSVHQAIVEAVRTGRISEERLNASVTRIQALKAKYLL